MDQSDIQTASTYINNLLLARGLLRDSTSIDFARLAISSKSRKKNEDGKEADVGKVTAQVMNLVHDMILKRDRDQTHQEHVAQSLLNLRFENTAANASVTRLTAVNTDLRRQIAAQQTISRTAQSAVRVAESSARTLRDELARVKIVLAQVRIQCANDVRKRDVELTRLKAHLSGQQRGSSNRNGAAALVGPSCSINYGSSSGAKAKEEEHRLSIQDTGYSLRQETNEFLTQLSQSLSDENDALIGLIRETLDTMRELQGLPEQGRSCLDEHDAHGQGHRLSANDELVKVLPTSYDVLATDLEVVLGNLRDLLTNPSFASIEEVQVRDDEIQRLRDGWEKMEKRWREAVFMMQGWKKRMLSGGDTVNLDELKMGLNLGEGLDSADNSNITREDADANADPDPNPDPDHLSKSDPTEEDGRLDELSPEAHKTQDSKTSSAVHTTSPISKEDPDFFEIHTSSAPQLSSSPSQSVSPLAEIVNKIEARSARSTTRPKSGQFLSEQENPAVTSAKPGRGETGAMTDDAAESEDELTKGTLGLRVRDLHTLGTGKEESTPKT